MMSSNHNTTIEAWVNIKMSGRNPPLYCSFNLITVGTSKHNNYYEIYDKLGYTVGVNEGTVQVVIDKEVKMEN